MRANVKHEFGKLGKALVVLKGKVMQDAVVDMLNNTRDDCREDLQKQMSRKIDRPTRTTMTAWDKKKYNNAKPKLQTAWLTMKRIQASYLYGLFYGGHESELHLVPGRQIRKNKFGNLGRRETKKKGTFQMIGDKKNGWRRIGRGGKGLLHVGHYTRSRSYKEMSDFEGSVRRVHGKVASKHFWAAFRRGLRAKGW